MGGLIALHVALAARHRVRSLALLCSFPRGADAMKLNPAMLWTGLRTRIGTKPQRRKAFLEMVMPAGALAESDPALLAAEMAPLFGHDLADQPAIAMKQLSAMRRYDASARLSELAGLRTLVVNAAHDRIARVEVGKAMAAAIPGARFAEIPDASHGATIHRAGQINALSTEHFG